MGKQGVWTQGTGTLHDSSLALAQSSGAVRVHPVGSAAEIPEYVESGLVVALNDGWEPAREIGLQRVCRSRRLHLLHGRLEGALGLIGPCVNPLRPGCVACAEHRRTMVLGTASREFAVRSRAAGVGAPTPLANALAEVALQVVQEHLGGGAEALERRVYALNGASLVGRFHSYTPVPNCPECGTVPDDAADRAQVVLEPRLQRRASDFRVQASNLTPQAMREKLFDWRYGLIPHVYRDEQTPLALSVAELPVLNMEQREAGFGRATSFPDGELVALLEALERHAGMSARGKRTVVRGSYSQLAADALNPASLGLHDPAFHDHPAFELLPYSPNLRFNWVWGYSFGEARAKLVPEQVVYYRRESVDATEDNDRFLYETSNGCALGSSFEEALLYALLEVIERDAFLMAWYGRLRVRELLLHGTGGLAAEMLVAKVEAKGYKVHFFDITNDFEVPAVWALAVHRGQNRAKSFSAAGANPDPARALLSALSEVATTVLMQPEREFYSPDRSEKTSRLRDMLRDPGRVKFLDDHVDLYTLHEAFERIEFLFGDDRRKVGLDEAFSGWEEKWQRDDLTQCLRDVISIILARGLDVIAVDQTSAEQRELGLRTVKAVVPGSLPMTFRHVYGRTRGLPRLLNVPAELGYWPRPAAYEDLDILPHPFP